jgi:hypothetical protein
MSAVLIVLTLVAGFGAAIVVSRKAVPRSYKIFAIIILMMMLAYVAASFRPAHAEEAFKEQPTTYHLQLIYVFEGNPVGHPECIFVLGQAGFKTVDALKRAIANFPEGTTLEWAPSCKRGEDEPLSTQKELDDLKAFCEKEKVKFVHIPSG